MFHGTVGELMELLDDLIQDAPRARGYGWVEASNDLDPQSV